MLDSLLEVEFSIIWKMGLPPHNDQSHMINMEIHSGKKMFNLIKPFAGFLYTTENTYYAYGGFGIDGYYGKKKIGF